LENHDRLARIWNIGLPSVPLESTQSHSPGQQAAHEKETFLDIAGVNRMTFTDASLPNGHAASACSLDVTLHYIKDIRGAAAPFGRCVIAQLQVNQS